jgi:hypothetical protein
MKGTWFAQPKAKHRECGGRRVVAKELAGQLVWASSTAGTLRHKALPTYWPKSKVKKPQARSLGGLQWTRRLKRLGGLAGLERLRLRHFELLAKVPESKLSDVDKQLAQGVFEWLRENPARVLPKATLSYFGWL